MGHVTLNSLGQFDRRAGLPPKTYYTLADGAVWHVHDGVFEAGYLARRTR